MNKNLDSGRPSFLKFIGTSAFMTVLIVSFQNCGEFVPNAQLIESQASFASMSSLDDLAERSIANRSIGLWKKPDNPTFVVPSGGGVVSDSLSFVAIITNPVDGTLVTINGGTSNTEDCALTLQSGVVRLFHLSDSTSYSVVSQNLNGRTGALVIAGRCGVSADDLELQINGVTSGQIVKQGSYLLDFGYILRTVQWASSTQEIVVYPESLSDFELNFLSRSIAPPATIVVADYSLAGPSSGGGNLPPIPDSRFTDMKAVFDAKCASCHSGFNTAESFVSANWVSRGSPANSKMFWRIKGSGVTSQDGKPQNMPMNSAISAAEIASIRTWIENLK